MDLPHFTLIGATTRAGLLTEPLRDRFGIAFRLERTTARRSWPPIVRALGGASCDVEIDDGGALEIARR